MLKATRIMAWLLALAILALSLVPPWMRPQTGVPHDLEHFGIFTATGFVFGLGYARRYGAVAIGLVIFAGAIETVQLFVPGRHARLSDFVVDALALLLGIAAAATFFPAATFRGD
jgi:VanZ family protein